MKTFYITTPIYYANSLPHLGHLYTTIVADVVHRYKKQRGYDVYFLTGTDEHGINIQRAAEKEGRSPQEQVDHISSELKRMFRDFGLDTESGGYDVFMRTTEPFHYTGVQQLWREIAKGKTPKGNDNIYKGHYEGWFCAPCAAFKAEDEYVIKEGSEVPVCLIHERPLDRVSEESYFFRLSDYEEFLLETIGSDPEILKPEARRNEVISFIKGGLQDLSISREKRSVSWGVPVPGDENHVMYVWLDALSNYITAIGYGNEERASVGFEKYWQNAVHIVGKDILRFHTVYWFSFLKAAGLPLPKMVYAHGMWLDVEGRKMGKTLRNVIEVDVLRRHFQVDAIRYFVLREMVFGQDGKFGYETLIERVNADLANGIGNLASRTLTMIRKFRDGVVPDGAISADNHHRANAAGLDPEGDELATMLSTSRDEFLRRFDEYEFSNALEQLWSVITRVDTMISDAKPWALAKDEANAEVINAVLYRAAETLRWLSVMLHPVMPESAERIFKQFNFDGNIAGTDPADLTWGGLRPGKMVGEPEAVFPRSDKSKIMSDINEQTSEPTSEVPPANVQPPHEGGPVVAAEEPAEEEQFITIDDFLKVDLRIGEIKVAERVPKADKLLRFEVDLGEGQPRQILAGLAEYYEPETLIGRKVVVVANLKPRKMRGLESQGMICAASLEDGTGEKPALATFIESVDIGARLK